MARGDRGRGRSADRGDGLTTNRQVLGSARYLAPEQAAGASSQVTPATDVFSLGAVFYFLLAGRPPFDERTMSREVIWHQARQPKPIREVRPETPAGLAAVP